MCIFITLILLNASLDVRYLSEHSQYIFYVGTNMQVFDKISGSTPFILLYPEFCNIKQQKVFIPVKVKASLFTC